MIKVITAQTKADLSYYDEKQRLEKKNQSSETFSNVRASLDSSFHFLRKQTAAHEVILKNNSHLIHKALKTLVF